MGCQSRQKFHKNELKKNSKGGHWGDLRAAVEISIDKVCEFAKKDPVALYGNSEAKLRSNSNSNQNSISNSKSGSLTRTAVKFSDDEDEEGEDVFSGNSPELIGAVRKNLCPALRDLLQHGMLPAAAAKRGQLIPVGCFPTRSQQVPASSGHQRHAWEMILHYYEMKVRVYYKVLYIQIIRVRYTVLLLFLLFLFSVLIFLLFSFSFFLARTGIQ